MTGLAVGGRSDRARIVNLHSDGRTQPPRESFPNPPLVVLVISRVAHDLYLEKGRAFLGDAKGLDTGNFAHYVDEREPVHYAAIGGDNEIGLASVHSLQQGKASPASATPGSQGTHVSSAVTNKRHLRRVQIGHDDFAGMAGRQHSPLVIDNLDD